MKNFFSTYGSCLLFFAASSLHAQQPALSAAELKIFNEVQHATFQYFWDGADPNSGLARERIHLDNIYPQNDQSVVTSGGSGFGIMALLVGIERKYISREAGKMRLEKIVHFLETADRFHGAWPHWWNGETGKVKPFSKKDNGGDLVETSYLLQGLLCARQYFQKGNVQEKALAARINTLWQQVEFNWYTQGKNILYWHWSPEYQWEMNFGVTGYNECLIMYVLAAASPRYSIDSTVYHAGWAQNGKIQLKYTQVPDHALQLRHHGDTVNGGPLFWAHYTYLGLNPHGLVDRYANYWKENTHQAIRNYQWCVANTHQYPGYGPNSWGLTASYSVKGYAGHAPAYNKDLGVISPTAALSSFPYTPKESMQAMVYWYQNKKEQLFGKYGFYDAFSVKDSWYPIRYLAIDQGPIVVMMENYRSGLLWKLFMSCPEVSHGLKKLGFSSPFLALQ